MAAFDHSADLKDPIHEITATDGHDSGIQTSTPSLYKSVKDNTAEQGRRWFHWHEPGTSKQEKRLIFKLDWFILSYGCLCFFNKYLDQTNISNAYVSGMEKELGFGPGNELSWMNTYFLIGYIIGGPISNLVLTIVPPRIWLPSCMLAWSLFVLFLYKCNTAAQFYGLRFCIGFFESAAFPGIHYVLGSWYRKSELARRSSLFVISGVLGQMFSGYLQAALYKGMNGRGGMSAWRWLFIFDFILAIPIAIYGFIFFPDTAETTKAFYLNEWERNRAKERIEEEGRTPVGKLNFAAMKRIFCSWQLWTFSISWGLWCLTCGSYIMQFFALWLKAEKTYSVPQINNIPTVCLILGPSKYWRNAYCYEVKLMLFMLTGAFQIIGAVNFFFMIGTGFVSDKLGNRGPVCLVVGALLTFCYIVLTVWDVPSGLKMAAFCLAGCYGCFSPLMAGWVNEICGGDQQLRAFTLAFMGSFGQGVVIPFQQTQFPSSQAPAYAKTHGYGSGLAFVVALTLWMGLGINYIEKRAPKWFKTRQQV